LRRWRSPWRWRPATTTTTTTTTARRRRQWRKRPPPVSTADAFFTYVMQLVSTQDETSEPGSVDGVVVTAPENTEPQPLPAS
jgi:hypothetical protein